MKIRRSGLGLDVKVDPKEGRKEQGPFLCSVDRNLWLLLLFLIINLSYCNIKIISSNELVPFGMHPKACILLFLLLG
jgi:hypothetical protein